MYELAGLHELDPSLDENDWPCLELRNATVWHKDSLIDLMKVSEHGPFMVKGTISKNDPGLKPGMIKSPNVFKTPLLIRKVYSYSIETTGDDNYKIWALGKAGWYHIKPAPEYKEIFQQTMKKARLWTFTEETYMDTLDEILKNPKAHTNTPLTPTFDQLCHEYAMFDNKHCRFPFSAKKWYKDDFRRFIIMRMLESQQETGRDWVRTPIYAFYKQHCPETIKELASALKRRKLKPDDAGNSVETGASPVPGASQQPVTEPAKPKVKKERLAISESIDTITVEPQPTKSRRRPRSSTSTAINLTPKTPSDARHPKRVKTSKYNAQNPTLTTPTVFQLNPEPRSSIGQTTSLPKLRKLKRKWDIEGDDAAEGSSHHDTGECFHHDTPVTASKGKSTLRPSGFSVRESSPLVKRSRSLSPFPTPQERLQKLKLQFEQQDLKEIAQQEYNTLLGKQKRMGMFEAYELPSIEPDENGYWKCHYGGNCYFKADSATDLKGLRAIENHMSGHFKDMRKILGVIGDESIGRLPKISHLISKVESLAESLAPQMPAPPEHPIWDFCR